MNDRVETKKWHVGWGAVHDCNMSCEFCYSASVRKSDSNIGYSDWINFIDDNHNSISDINYGTGENTLSEDWFQLVNYIRTHYPDIKQALTTNGYLITQVRNNKLLHDIVVRSIDEIDVSLDFADEQKYCSLRGNKNVFKWALGTLEFCSNNNIPSTIVTIGAKPILDFKNIDGLFTIAKLYNSKVRMNIYRPTSPNSFVNDKFIAPFRTIVNTLYYIDSKYKTLSISDPLFSSILTQTNFKPDPSGNNSVRILHNGMITPSTYLVSSDFQCYSITEKKILKKIEKEGAFFDFSKIPPICNDCHLCKNCKGGVYDRRYLWYQDFSERDPYCPFRLENYLPKRYLHVHNDVKFRSVHDGYLPTLFFSY